MVFLHIGSPKEILPPGNVNKSNNELYYIYFGIILYTFSKLLYKQKYYFLPGSINTIICMFFYRIFQKDSCRCDSDLLLNPKAAGTSRVVYLPDCDSLHYRTRRPAGCIDTILFPTMSKYTELGCPYVSILCSSKTQLC